MQEISRSLDGLSAQLERVLTRAPELQREIHETLGAQLLTAVRQRAPISLKGHRVSASEYHARGTLRQWQSKYIGSRGGYAAVRATDEPKGNNGAGAITNYVENGHRSRVGGMHASRRTKRRWRQYGAPYSFVNGRGFYHSTQADAERLLTRAAEQLANQIAEEFER